MPKQPIQNAGSNPDVLQRRTGGSVNDPHGGHERPQDERRGPDPDPVEELVPDGSGGLPPSKRTGKR